jgi:hypothetical protein
VINDPQLEELNQKLSEQHRDRVRKIYGAFAAAAVAIVGIAVGAAFIFRPR